MEYPITDQRCVNQVFKGCPNRKCFGKFAHTNLPSVILSTCTFLYSPLTLHPPSHILLPHVLLHTPSSHPPLHTLPPLTPSSSHPPLHTLPPHMHPLFSHPNTRHTALQKFVICPLASQQGQRHYTSSSKVHHFSMSCDVT